MKINWFYIKMGVLAGITLFLFAFSSKRNEKRQITKVEVNFKGADNLFITADAVDKLLIQKNQGLTGQSKEIIVLKELEDRLDSHAMIADADVYTTIDGVVGANVTQRKPIARVEAVQPFYIDQEGQVMPLSANYSARVPLISGLPKDKIDEVYELLQVVVNDEFLKKQIVGIVRDKSASYTLIPRVMDYRIRLGKIENLSSKFSNYKAFYQKALKDKSLNTYSLVDLRFKGQVVGQNK